MDTQKRLKSNIQKYFLIILTNRRNYIPILALYFLSLPNTTVQQIGLYIGIGWIVGFLFEIPSGYVSDKIGHKTALIIAKFSMLASSLFFVFGNSLPQFILGSAFISIGFAMVISFTLEFLISGSFNSNLQTFSKIKINVRGYEKLHSNLA